MGQNKAVKGHEGTHEGARAYPGRPSTGPASEMAPCVENYKLYTLLHSQIKQQWCMSTLADTIWVRARQRGVVKGHTRAPALTEGGPSLSP